MTDQVHWRTVRSFVRRTGRITPRQKRAFSELWPLYGLASSQDLLNLDQIFGRAAHRSLEIGFGMGENLIDLAERHPERDYIGIEVHRPGVGKVLAELDTRQLTNVRLSNADATDVLTKQIADESFDEIMLFFPDPWPKNRHHKRRLVQPKFVELIRQKLKIGGRFHMATDWEDYARHALAVFASSPGFANAAEGPGYAARPTFRPLTKFERRGASLGHGIWELVFVRVPLPAG